MSEGPSGSAHLYSLLFAALSPSLRLNVLSSCSLRVSDLLFFRSCFLPLFHVLSVPSPLSALISPSLLLRSVALFTHSHPPPCCFFFCLWRLLMCFYLSCRHGGLTETQTHTGGTRIPPQEIHSRAHNCIDISRRDKGARTHCPNAVILYGFTRKNAVLRMSHSVQCFFLLSSVVRQQPLEARAMATASAAPTTRS